jgi:hypothetical protein
VSIFDTGGTAVGSPAPFCFGADRRFVFGRVCGGAFAVADFLLLSLVSCNVPVPVTVLRKTLINSRITACPH